MPSSLAVSGGRQQRSVCQTESGAQLGAARGSPSQPLTQLRGLTASTTSASTTSAIATLLIAVLLRARAIFLLRAIVTARAAATAAAFFAGECAGAEAKRQHRALGAGDRLGLDCVANLQVGERAGWGAVGCWNSQLRLRVNGDRLRRRIGERDRHRVRADCGNRSGDFRALGFNLDAQRHGGVGG